MPRHFIYEFPRREYIYKEESDDVFAAYRAVLAKVEADAIATKCRAVVWLKPLTLAAAGLRWVVEAKTLYTNEV